MRTPLGNTVRLTSESPDAVKDSSGVSRGSRGAPFIESSLGHRGDVGTGSEDAHRGKTVEIVPRHGGQTTLSVPQADGRVLAVEQALPEGECATANPNRER